MYQLYSKDRIPGIQDSFIFSILLSSSSSFLENISFTFLIFFFNLCSNLKFCHTEMCLKYFNVILKWKILIGRMIVLAVVSYCELTDVNSYS